MKNNTICLAMGFLLVTFNACKTDDVAPKNVISFGSSVSLSVNNAIISENNDSAIIKVELNTISSSDVQVILSYTGTAILNTDYSSNITIVIPSGSLSNTASLFALQDTLKEGNEIINIAIESVIGAAENGIQITEITIEDDDVTNPINLIFNEILYDPSNSGLDGDANGDGIYSQSQDEFIELYNNSSKAIDLSGYKIFDANALLSDTPRHVIIAGTILQPQKALVIFGGGSLTGTFGNALVQKTTTGDLNLTNAGDVITIKDALNIVVLSIDITPWSDNPNESYTRNPDITGDFVQHVSVNAKKFSPGTKVTGDPF
jgi:hypothetical protein